MNPIIDGPEKEKSAKKQRVDVVESALLNAGYIIPRNESEVDIFEQAMKLRKDIPPIPDDLKDADTVLINAKKKRAKSDEPKPAETQKEKAPLRESNVYRTLAEWRERTKNSFS